MILVVIDAHSKWIEAVCTSGSASAVVIEELHTIFVQFGLPETLVSDNGACFVSAEFRSFLQKNGIKQVTKAPYYSSSNCLAEHAMRIIKRGLKKNKEGSIQKDLAKTLFTYRMTPQVPHLQNCCWAIVPDHDWTYRYFVLIRLIEWNRSNEGRKNCMMFILRKASLLWVI